MSCLVVHENDKPDTARNWQAAMKAMFPDDKLREMGFAIFSRPAKGPVMWWRRGVTFAEADLVRRYNLRK